MGKSGSWFTAVRKVLYPETKKDLKPQKTKKRWFGRQADADDTTLASPSAAPPPPPPPPPRIRDSKLPVAETEEPEDHAYSIVAATAMAAKAAAAAAQAAAEVVRLTRAVRFPGKTKKEVAAIKIQTAYRRYLCRRAVRAMKGSERLRALMEGRSVKRQAASALQRMQTISRLQSQVRARRMRMSEDNQALQRQLQQNCGKEGDKPGTPYEHISAEDWNVSTKSKEQLQAKEQKRQLAAIRRERALAYSFSHQRTWKNSSPKASEKPMMPVDPNSPHWGWSWLERWMAARPWENQIVVDPIERGSPSKTVTRSPSIGESTVGRKLSTAGKSKSPVSKASTCSSDNDQTSPSRAKSADRYRRHSIPGPLVRGDESLASSPSSARAAARSRSCFPSPLGVATRKRSAAAAPPKKRHSTSVPPPSDRRRSGPPKLETASKKDAKVGGNGGGKR